MFRLISAFSVLSLVTVSSAGAIAFFRARAIIERLIFERLEVTATLKEEALNLWVENQREAVAALAQLPEIRYRTSSLLSSTASEAEANSAYTQIQEFLTSIVTTRPELKELFILTDVGGQIVASTEPSREGLYRVKDKYFTEGREGTFVQNVYPSSSTGKPTMTISTPLLDEKGDRVGVLAAHLNLERMDRIVLERTGLGESGEAYLIDRFNLFVSAERFGRSEFPRGVHSDGINAALLEKDGSKLYLNYAEVPVIGVYRWLDDRELALLVEIQQREAFIPARKLAVTIVGGGALLAGILTVAIYLLARSVARPILAIADTAVKVSKGDLTHLAPVMTEDEVGILAETFNQMTEQLQILYAKMGQKVELLEIEREKSDRLLLNILPCAIAERLKQEPNSIIAESFETVTVLFADLVQFTQLSATVTPVELVHSLNEIFSTFDFLAQKYGLEKIKTIGDAYMVVGGLPTPREDAVEAIADLALEMLSAIRQLAQKSDRSFQLRVGIHTGPVVAGVIGLNKFSYDLWGDTVNTASRMESQGLPGRVQVTATTYELLRHKYVLEERGKIDVKGKGEMLLYFLNCRKSFHRY
ncbi:MAG: adenylate/guanylate cyclase domain-containing protein [Cyanobacteriota bacterium]|nr:adenylate/guanylate cyclase domain-containing protein [Cyanobacteriota bacterium]